MGLFLIPTLSSTEDLSIEPHCGYYPVCFVRVVVQLAQMGVSTLVSACVELLLPAGVKDGPTGFNPFEEGYNS